MALAVKNSFACLISNRRGFFPFSPVFICLDCLRFLYRTRLLANTFQSESSELDELA